MQEGEPFIVVQDTIQTCSFHDSSPPCLIASFDVMKPFTKKKDISSCESKVDHPPYISQNVSNLSFILLHRFQSNQWLIQWQIWVKQGEPLFLGDTIPTLSLVTYEDDRPIYRIRFGQSIQLARLSFQPIAVSVIPPDIIIFMAQPNLHPPNSVNQSMRMMYPLLIPFTTC